MVGPTLPISQHTHEIKYRSAGESFRECMNRIASTLSDNEEHFHTFKDILMSMRFLPAGRTQAAVGTTKLVTPFNCFVSGTIEDTLLGKNGIMERAKEAAQTMRMGGGIGYDFSTLRPKGEYVSSTESRSAGPVSFMSIFDSICHVINSTGNRKGAQMAVLRIDHPDIEEFIHAKQNTDKLTGFNTSVAVTDEFIDCLLQHKSFDLRFHGQIFKTIEPSILWEAIMRSTWDWAEPGVLFIDTINRMNNLWYCETISATNPCAEQPLPPFGACLLGSFNLTKYLNDQRFNMNQFTNDVGIVVRSLDKIIDTATYPLPEQKTEAQNKRRMGLGITGLANAGEFLGHSYGSPGFIQFMDKILSTLRDEAYKASADLAKEKGAFPLYKEEQYLQGEFIKRLPQSIISMIKSNGIRNSHLISIAPTGTISLCADNISSGLEPVFDYKLKRTILKFGGSEEYILPDYGHYKLGVHGKRSVDCTSDDHLNVLFKAYEYVDSAVSKTCNIDNSMSWDDFKNIYIRAWKAGCKGCTTFNPTGKRMGILEGVACYIDPETGDKDCG